MVGFIVCINGNSINLIRGYPTLSHRLSRPWFIFDWLYALTQTATKDLAQIETMRQFTKRCIAARRQLPPTPNRLCLLDFLLQMSEDSANRSDFTPADAVEEAITFMLAGQDAVGSALAFALYLLSQNEPCQRRARRAIELSDSAGLHGIEQLHRLAYLRQCVEETLRLYPSVPLIARRLGEPVRLASGLRLPAGSNVLIFPYALHRLEHVFVDAERFDPERFDRQQQPANGLRPSCAYLPFSDGPRRCIGDQFAMLEMQMMLAAVLRRFDLRASTKQLGVQPIFRVTLRSSGGLWVVMQKRPVVTVQR